MVVKTPAFDIDRMLMAWPHGTGDCRASDVIGVRLFDEDAESGHIAGRVWSIQVVPHEGTGEQISIIDEFVDSLDHVPVGDAVRDAHDASAHRMVAICPVLPVVLAASGSPREISRAKSMLHFDW